MVPEQRGFFSQLTLGPTCVGCRAMPRLPDGKLGTIMLVGAELSWLAVTEVAPVLDAPALLILWR